MPHNRQPAGAPTRARTLLTLSAAVSLLIARPVPSEGQTVDPRIAAMLDDVSAEQLYEYYRAMSPMYSLMFDAEKFEKSWKQGIRNYEQLNLGFGGFLREFDFTEELHTIPCPTLVLGGAHDWICPAEHSRMIAERIPRAHLKIFPDSSHSIPQDQPEEFLAAVRGFLTCATRIDGGTTEGTEITE